MKRYIKAFQKLKMLQKIECVAAMLCTLLLLVAFPVYAWFNFANRLETMARIKEPDNLDIKAGNEDQIINFDLRDIDIEYMKENDESKYYVFSVGAGDYKISYHLKLAHTTNIPLKYEIYKAELLSGSDTILNTDVAYHPLDDESDVTYYRCAGTPLNMDILNAADTSEILNYGRNVAKRGIGDTYYNDTYEATDEPNIYAVPLYYKTTTPITPNSESTGPDYFVLKLTWVGSDEDNTNYAKWNQAENNKETDIIFITASRTTY